MNKKSLNVNFVFTKSWPSNPRGLTGNPVLEVSLQEQLPGQMWTNTRTHVLQSHSYMPVCICEARVERWGKFMACLHQTC